MGAQEDGNSGRGGSTAKMSGVTYEFERAVVNDLEAYSEVVAAIDMDRWQAGGDSGPTSVAALETDQIAFNAGRLGFSMTARTTIADDHVVLAHITSAPAGSRWCDFDLVPGAMLAYGPSSLHTATSPAGFAFEYVSTSIDCIGEVADDLGIGFKSLERGAVLPLDPTPGVDRLAGTFRGLRTSVERDTPSPASVVHSIIGDIALALSDLTAARRSTTPRHVASRRIVHRCIDFAESVGCIPSIQELCLASHVSERRLRAAFTEEFDQPPTLFFRRWALHAARRRLLVGGDRGSITRVATDVGFAHLGRFAGEYRSLFGETPSMTIRNAHN